MHITVPSGAAPGAVLQLAGAGGVPCRVHLLPKALAAERNEAWHELQQVHAS